MGDILDAAPEPPALERRLVDDGVLLEGVANPPTAAAALADHIATPLARQLERAAWWPDHEDRCGPRLGEYADLSIGFGARDYKGLYVNVQSEPYCDLVLDVSASQGDPDLATTAPKTMREVLLRRGYQPGSPRAGFWRRVTVHSAEDCRTVAEAIAGLMVEGLGYDPTRRVTFRHALHERAREGGVLHALSLGDVARLLRSLGLVVWQDRLKCGQPVWRTIEPRRFNVYPFCETAAGSGLFAASILGFATTLTPEGAEAALREARRMSFHCDVAADDHGVTVFQTLTLHGGVTEEHLRIQLQAWRKYLKRIVEAGREAEVDDDAD